jgi:photosystem II stability/assembly factor-like uncharacterized protein
MKAGLVALSVVLAVAIAAGLLNLRGGYHSPPGDQPKPTPVQLTPVSRNPIIEAMGRFDSDTGWVEIHALDADDTGRATSYLRWTADGGRTWSERRPVPLPPTETGMDGVQFVDTSHGWTSSYLVQSTPGGREATIHVWRTSDGGLSWQSSSIPVGTLKASGVFRGGVHFRDPLHGEAFDIRGPALDPDTGFAARSTAADWTCERFSTSDGGVTWSAPKPIPCLAQIAFTDSLLGYSFDWFGAPVLYVTLDGGQTWTAGTLPSEPTGSKYEIPMLLERRSDGTLRALMFWVKDDGPSIYAIVVSGDAGRTWTMAGTASAGDAMTRDNGLPIALPIAVRDENNWVTAPIKQGNEPDPWFGTGDGGLTWTHFTYAGLTGDIKDFDFLNGSDGWAATDTYDAVAALWATTDGGATWTRILSTP